MKDDWSPKLDRERLQAKGMKQRVLPPKLLLEASVLPYLPFGSRSSTTRSYRKLTICLRTWIGPCSLEYVTADALQNGQLLMEHRTYSLVRTAPSMFAYKSAKSIKVLQD